MPNHNIQISSMIKSQLFGILNFSHCDLFVICFPTSAFRIPTFSASAIQ
jgi:hypothetical protein